MPDDIRIIGRPQLNPGVPAPRLTAPAQQHDWLGGLPQPNADIDGLVRGLSVLNPALQNLAGSQTALAAEQKSKKDAEDKLGGSALSQQITNVRDALTGAPIEAPVTVPQAFSPAFLTAMRQGLANRAAVGAKGEAMTEYNTLKDQPDFNPVTWLAQKRQAALAGIQDPEAVSIIGNHFTEFEGLIKANYARDQLQRADDIKNQTATLIAADMFTGNLTPDQLFDAYGNYKDRVKPMGVSQKEAAQFLLLQVQAQSDKLGGAPEMFDVFNKPDAEGYTLAQRNPNLAQHIQAGKEHARQLRDRALDQAAEQGNALKLIAYENDIDHNPASVTQDRLLGDFTPHGALRSAAQVASLWDRAQDATRKQLATQAFMADGLNGTLYRHDAKVQSQVLDQMTGPAVQQLVQATSQGDQQGIQKAAMDILQAHTRSGATVPVETLQRYVKSLVTQAPSKDGPTPQFEGAVSLYKTLSGVPQYRSMYFNEDASNVLDAYASARSLGTDAKAAYVQAYQSVSPEAKSAAEAFVKTPAFQDLVQKDAKKYVEGSSWIPTWVGGNGRPQNVSSVGAAIAGELRTWRARNPFANDAQADAFAQEWVSKNFVLDTTSRNAIKVPPAYAGPSTQEALSDLSADISKRLHLQDRIDASWSVQYIPTGTEGNYQAIAFNGAASKVVGPVNLDAVLANQRARKILSPDEAKALGQFRMQLAQGSTSDNIVMPGKELLAKGEALGVLKPEEIAYMRKVSQTELTNRLNGLPKFNLGAPSFDNLQFVPGKGSTIDNSLTARVSRELMGSPVASMSNVHQGYAASLIAMGEGVALQAYDDPAQGAGRNIGMGYNLKANAANAASDLKRAGVPDERIQDVIDGRAAILPDQAKRLLMVAMPRYEKQAQETAESTSPGLWTRMAPAQKAVMIDMAWQLGSTDKFKKAWTMLANNDMAGFTNETKVFYTDRSGERKEDTRRGNLRAAMLAGIPYWQATVDKYGALPGNKLDALTEAAPLQPPVPLPTPPGQTLMDRLGDLGKDYTTPEGKKLLKSRVAEAAGGGKALTDVEKLRARQALLLQ